MKKKKVLIVGLTSGVGGVETFICNVVKNLDFNYIDLEFLMHQELNSKYINELSNINYKMNMVSGVKNNPIKFVIDLVKFFKNNKYDVVHLNECDSTFFIYVFPLLFSKKTKLIVHSHNGDSKTKKIHMIMKKIQERRTDVKWACSEIAANWMFNDKNVTIIHNGIDLNNYKFSLEKRKKIRKELQIDDDCLVIVSIARFHAQKNHEKILSIFEKYWKKNKKSYLLLVGEGEEKNKIFSLSKSLECNSNIKFLGIRNDIPSIMCASDLLLMPSLFEGLPFVIVEAQACSLQVLMSDTVSKESKLTDLVEDYPLDSSDEDWANKINQMLIKKIDRSNNNYQWEIAKKGYDIKAVSKLIESEYIMEMRKND